MSSVSGVNLSSLLSSLGSSSSGINVASAVSQAMAALSAPETNWEAQQTTLAGQTSGIDQIQADVDALQTSLTTLSDPAGALASMTATSSDTDVVSASAAVGATAGTHVVVVTNIASSASAYSNSVATSSTPLAAGSFTLTSGSGTATTIQIGTGTNTLDELAASINTQNIGVTASVVNDSSGSRLALVSNNTGSAAGFTVSAASSLTFTQPPGGEGQDASLTVDGIPVDSASNTVSGVLSGVTLNLVGAAQGGEVTVTVAPDATQVTQAIATFATAYNTAIGDVNTQYTVSALNQEGPLAGDSTVQILQNSLLSAAGYTGGGNGVSTLADLGITMNSDGTLSVNSTTLSNAIQNNFSGVQNFMQGASSNGFASFLNTQLNTLTAGGTGAFTVDLQSISSENSDLQNQINNFQTYLSAQQTRLTAQYNQADITLQEIPEEEAQINGELGYPPTSSTS
jgi:flagellar hook-associated protein 2